MPIFFLEQKKVFIWEKNSIPPGLFRYTNMAAMRSYENKSVEVAEHSSAGGQR